MNDRVKMSSSYGTGHYLETLGSEFEYLKSSDGSLAYSVTCDIDCYMATGSGNSLIIKTPIIASSGDYNVLSTPPSSMLSKYCRVKLSDCSFNLDVNNIGGSSSSVIWFNIKMYVGDSDNVDKILYRYDAVVSNNSLNVLVPKFNFVDVPSGKNVFVEIYAGKTSGTNGLCISYHVVSNIDD